MFSSKQSLQKIKHKLAKESENRTKLIFTSRFLLHSNRKKEDVWIDWKKQLCFHFCYVIWRRLHNENSIIYYSPKGEQKRHIIDRKFRMLRER